MYDYFKAHLSQSTDIMKSDTDLYRDSLVKELKELGACDSELNLIRDSIIINAIRNKRKPKDVAWAIMQ